MSFRQRVVSSPMLARTVPFIIFLLLTFSQDYFGEPGRYWIYFFKSLVGAWFIWQMRSVVTEMRWAWSWEAVAMGVAVFVMWVAIDSLYPHVPKKGLGWNPFSEFYTSPAHAWFFVAARIIGSTLVVPPLEEVFYRSFIYRWIIQPDFQNVPLNQFNRRAFVITAVIFGFAHFEWLAGILCAFAYQWLVLRKNRLGDAITAHAITNFLLGVWVVWREAWNFW
jgi:CAAX prenyl protease-like protein